MEERRRIGIREGLLGPNRVRVKSLTARLRYISNTFAVIDTPAGMGDHAKSYVYFTDESSYEIHGPKPTTVSLMCGDASDKLRSLAPKSVACVATSSAYFGQRDYQTATWIGGNDPRCDHVANPAATKVQGNPAFNVGRPSRGATKLAGYYFAGVCDKCGATRVDLQIGLEPTIAEYIAKLVAVYREVWRVLRDDGTLWIVIGDSYGGSGKGRKPDGSRDKVSGKQATNKGGMSGTLPSTPGRAKELLGIPWLLANALKADGWLLRQEIIWEKSPRMPESVCDRCTKEHEFIFMLTKQRRYFYNADAISTPVTAAFKQRDAYDIRNFGRSQNSGRLIEAGHYANHEFANRGSVWKIAPQPQKGHYATFPEEIPRRAILAGTRPGDTVLDCFMGSGTTGVVAKRLGRNFIGIDLNPKYVKLAKRRIESALRRSPAISRLAKVPTPAIPPRGSVEWETPRDVFAKLDAEFHFTLDAAASHANRLCARYYTVDDDGLAKNWDGERVWLNPPYDRSLGKWMEKASETKGIVVCVVPANRTDTRWWQNYAAKGEVRFLPGRLKFSGCKNTAKFASAIVIFRND